MFFVFLKKLWNWLNIWYKNWSKIQLFFASLKNSFFIWFLVILQKWALPCNLSDIVYESPLIFLTFHNMQIDRNGLQFVRVALVLTTMIGIDLSQNGRRFESKQLFFIWKVLRTLRKWHNLPIFWQWSTISVPEKKVKVVSLNRFQLTLSYKLFDEESGNDE